MVGCSPAATRVAQEVHPLANNINNSLSDISQVGLMEASHHLAEVQHVAWDTIPQLTTYLHSGIDDLYWAQLRLNEDLSLLQTTHEDVAVELTALAAECARLAAGCQPLTNELAASRQTRCR